MRECTAALTRAARKRTCHSEERGASIAAEPEAVARRLRTTRKLFREGHPPAPVRVTRQPL